MRGATDATHESLDPSIDHSQFGQAGRLPYVSHESPPVMTIPLAVLAVCAILLSIFGTPAWPWLQSYLNGTPAKFDLSKLFQGDVLSVMVLSTLIMGAGMGLGWWWYGLKPIQTADEADVLERRWPDIFALLRNKFYVDEMYHMIFVKPFYWLSEKGVLRLEKRAIEPALRSPGRASQRAGQALRWVQSGSVNVYVAAMAMGVIAILVFGVLWP